jgi:SprT-like family
VRQKLYLFYGVRRLAGRARLWLKFQMRKRAIQGYAEVGAGGRLHLTPECLETAYEYLRATLPFRRMNLPHADNLIFRVMGARDRFGHFRGRIKTTPELNEIGVSIRVVKSTDLLMATMAHEMIHLYQHENGSCTKSAHNAEFGRIAARVCRIHGFDHESF